MAAEPQAAGVTTAQKWLVLGFGFFGWLFAGATLEVSPGKDAMVSTGLETGVVTDLP